MARNNSITECIYRDAQIENAANQLQRTHIDICKQLVDLHQKSGVPMRLLIYIAIGTNAHKRAVYNALYKKIDINKANDVIKMVKMLSKVYGNKYIMNDAIYHTLSRFYDLGGYSDQFKKILENNKVECMNALSTSKDIAKKLFQGSTFSENGYLMKI